MKDVGPRLRSPYTCILSPLPLALSSAFLTETQVNVSSRSPHMEVADTGAAEWNPPVIAQHLASDFQDKFDQAMASTTDSLESLQYQKTSSAGVSL